MEISPKKQCKEAGQYVVAVLRRLSLSRGEQHVGEMWREANLNWEMFLPSSDIETFISQNVS